MKQRASNIELLRIVSMIFIVTYHCLCSIESHTQYPDLVKGAITVSHIGVICFVLISGYWGIRFSLKGFLKLYIQCMFYSVVIYLFYSLINPGQFNIKDCIKSLFPFQWWFIQIYLCLYLIIPIVNLPIRSASAPKKLFLITLLGILSFGFGQFTPSLIDGKNPINFVFIYYIGNYLRYNISDKLRTPVNRPLFLYILLNILIFCILVFTGNQPFVQNSISHFFFPYNSLGLILNATLLFLVFTAIRVQSKFINWLASSVLPIYLIHENKYIGEYLYGFVVQMHTSISPALFAVFIILIALIVCLSCILIDKALSPLIQKITSLVLQHKYIQKADKKIEDLLQE